MVQEFRLKATPTVTAIKLKQRVRVGEYDGMPGDYLEISRGGYLIIHNRESYEEKYDLANQEVPSPPTQEVEQLTPVTTWTASDQRRYLDGLVAQKEEPTVVLMEDGKPTLAETITILPPKKSRLFSKTKGEATYADRILAAVSKRGTPATGRELIDELAPNVRIGTVFSSLRYLHKKGLLDRVEDNNQTYRYFLPVGK